MSSPTSTKELVLSHLRGEKIKLWLPPYAPPPRINNGGGGCNECGREDDDALDKLAKSLHKKISSSPAGRSITVEEILTVLSELRSHAVQKLKEKNTVVIKILATQRHFESLSLEKAATGDNDRLASSTATISAPSHFASWGDEVTIERSTTHKNNSSNSNQSSLLVRVVSLSSSLAVDDFSSDICRALNAETVRVILRGKNLSNGQDTLRNIVMTNDNKKKKNELLCIVSGFGYVPPAASENAASIAPSSTTSQTERTDSSIIEAIRQAAHTIQNSRRGPRFEVTDQHGSLVPMTKSDTVAFLTALGLHRVGRSRMEKRGAFGTATTQSDDGGSTSSGRDAVASALVFLLEADAEWNTSAALQSWRSKVDNYGLLQLDIAWCYLLLESLDDLHDAIRRLDIAEKVLRKQVHSNFVTLALTQAEMDNPIPPLCSVFCRLFLLQGVANRMQNNHDASSERLGWAQLLCNKLQSTCPPDSVESLCNAYLVDPSTAIAALRRSNGDPDSAGNSIAADRADELRAAKKRRRQHRIGRCENGTDFVDLDLVPALAGMLGFGDATGTENDEGNQSTSTSIVISLLRLSNNAIDRALELYSTTGAEQVLKQVERLDEASGRRKRRSSKTSSIRNNNPSHEVQDMDLTMLLSMGVDEARSRDALKATGNVESALLWLSRDDHGDEAINADASGSATGNSNRAATLTANENKLGPNGAAKNNDGNSSSSSSFESEEEEEEAGGVDDAHELLERELGNALGTDSSRQLEKEWLGVDLKEEWELIQRYISKYYYAKMMT